MRVKLIDQFTGALLGLMTGDALGRSAKGHTPEELLERVEEESGHRMIEMIGGFYTEDTEMMIAVAETLLAQGRIDQPDLARRLGENLDPMRGHNPGELEVLYRLQQGVDWRDANREVFEEGSFGIGGAPRAAPVGLFYHDDLDMVIEAAAAAAEVTHAHPLGMAGAVVVALGVALAVKRATPRDLFDEIQDLLAASGYGDFLPFLAVLPELLESWPSPPQVVEKLGGNALTVQRCVPAGLYSVLRHPDSFEKAVGFAGRLGGDADSIGAITGAIAGAYHGVNAIPAAWVNRLENEERGRDFVIDLGERLHSAWKTSSSD
jgi:poly(ADP-ribose) glycohydrolase ARH3